MAPLEKGIDITNDADDEASISNKSYTRQRKPIPSYVNIFGRTISLATLHPFGIDFDPNQELLAMKKLKDAEKLLCQVDRTPTSLGEEVYRSYEVYESNGMGLFQVLNVHSQRVHLPFTEFKIIGYDGVEFLRLMKQDVVWGDEEFFWCIPSPHLSDGMRVIQGDREIGNITVQKRYCNSWGFWGCCVFPFISTYHNRYYISYEDENSETQRAITKGNCRYGLIVLEKVNGTCIAEIKTSRCSNCWSRNDPKTPDIKITFKNSTLDPIGKGVIIALAVRHALNVLRINRRNPRMFKIKLRKRKKRRWALLAKRTPSEQRLLGPEEKRVFIMRG